MQVEPNALSFDPAGAPAETTRIEPRSVSVGLVGTYPPTRCGIATFTASLREAMAPLRSGVVALVDEAGASPFAPEVVAELVPGSNDSLETAAVALEAFDVVVVQHEFGIYGGKDGSEVIDLVRRLGVPVIVVLHTVLRSPSPRQHAIVEGTRDSGRARSRPERRRQVAASGAA